MAQLTVPITVQRKTYREFRPFWLSCGIKTERMRIKEGQIRIVLQNHELWRKSCSNHILPLSGHFSLIPVIPGCGGVPPGQNRDKFQSKEASYFLAAALVL